jgi:hypothetical protein
MRKIRRRLKRCFGDDWWNLILSISRCKLSETQLKPSMVGLPVEMEKSNADVAQKLLCAVFSTPLQTVVGKLCVGKLRLQRQKGWLLAAANLLLREGTADSALHRTIEIWNTYSPVEYLSLHLAETAVLQTLLTYILAWCCKSTQNFWVSWNMIMIYQ